MARWISVIYVLLLCACSGAPQGSGTALPAANTQPQPVPFAWGPIAKACTVGDRRAASQARCGCVQAAADRTLSQKQQQSSIIYFDDPGLLQTVRQSGARSNERFWADWTHFADTAEALCVNA